MSSLKKLVAALTLVLALGASGRAHAATLECQLRNISFVSTMSDGRLIINAEMWAVVSGQWVKQGQLNNATYCSVNTTLNNISTAVCKDWYQVALAAMMSNKKVYFNAPACPTNNGATVSGIGLFGLNN